MPKSLGVVFWRAKSAAVKLSERRCDFRLEFVRLIRVEFRLLRRSLSFWDVRRDKAGLGGAGRVLVNEGAGEGGTGVEEPPCEKEEGVGGKLFGFWDRIVGVGPPLSGVMEYFVGVMDRFGWRREDGVGVGVNEEDE